MAQILQMQGIEKRFGGVHALRGVDFSIAAGEVVALVGENGAGKSTLMKILGGVYQPDAGTLLIDDAPVRIHSVADAIKRGIAFIHQELNVLGNLDVAANVFLGREPVRFGFLRLIDRKRMHADTKVYLEAPGPGRADDHAGRRSADSAAADGRDCQSAVFERAPLDHG